MKKCSFIRCLFCKHKECWTGQVAREYGYRAYCYHLKMLDEVDKNLE